MHNVFVFIFSCLFCASMALLALRHSRDTLAAFIVLQIVLANLFVFKQITLFSFNATASDFLIIGVYFSMNLFNERYGKLATTRLVQTTGLALGFMLIAAQVVLAYTPSPTDYMADAFSALFVNTPRVLVIGFGVYLLSQYINVHTYTALRRAFPQIRLPLINGAAIAFSQTIDTALFTWLALYGIVSSLWQIFIVSLSIKFLTIMVFAPFSTFVLKNESVNS